MAHFTDYVWCVAVGGIACFTMGFGIGANDVSNNFGTSIGSKAITLGKAVIIASIFEFIGSVCLGASVTDSVRNGVLYADKFADQPDLLMYGNLCALMTSTIWLLFASKYGMPVSTTHSMIGSLMGVGLAIGPSVINWMYFLKVIGSWLVSPVLAMFMGMFYYWLVRTCIMRKPNATQIGMRYLWLLLLILCCVFMMFFTFSNPVILNGVSCTVDGVRQENCVLDDWIYDNVGLGFAISMGVGALLCALLAPICYWKARRNLRRFEALENAYSKSLVVSPESFRQRSTPDVEAGEQAIEIPVPSSASSIKSVSTMVTDKNSGSIKSRNIQKDFSTDFPSSTDVPTHVSTTAKEALETPNCWRRLFEHLPWKRDLHMEAWEEDSGALELQTKGEKFDPKSEQFFAVLQIISACVTCVVHGSNDVANATAPFASVYSIYQNSEYEASIAVPVWILALGGSAIGVGLTFLGHHVIRKVGCELVKMSPSRGFCMEMGMATVMVIGSFIGLPLSTTHCMVGSAVGVALLDPDLSSEEEAELALGNTSLPACSKLNWNAVNWKLMSKIGLTWAATLVFTAATSCALYAFSIYGPSNVHSYYDYIGPH